jgi:hypothetical protein
MCWKDRLRVKEYKVQGVTNPKLKKERKMLQKIVLPTVISFGLFTSVYSQTVTDENVDPQGYLSRAS